MAIWRMTPDGPLPVQFAALATEQSLESMIVKDPTVLGSDLMFIGRQVLTDYGGYVDVLALDADGHVHVLELKRDRTPREVVAQVIDYGSWAKDLTLDQVAAIFALQHDIEFEDAFAEHFGAPIPDVFNADQQLTVVAAALDPASDRIITYLAERYGVPINAVFFRYFADGDVHYLARTWLMAQEQTETRKPGRTTTSKVRPWNGRDFYCILGTIGNHSERWEVGLRYGFVGAGGGSWYWKPLRSLGAGKRVFAYVGGVGYVGIGEVTGAMVPLRELQVIVDGSTLKVVDQPDLPPWMTERAHSLDDDVTEYAVPVRWLVGRPLSEAVSERGLFASQLPACKLRDERTIEVVMRSFGLTDDG